MSPQDDTDPTAGVDHAGQRLDVPSASGANSTDPIFPPKLGKAGPRAVSVTAVQGPGVDPPASKLEVTTTERLLTGLLDSPSPDVKRGPEKPRKRESSGEEAAAYNVSPRPVPVAHTEDGAEPPVVVAPPSHPQAAAGAGARRAHLEPTQDLPGPDARRDDRTVPLPRKPDRRRALVAFFVALAVVWLVGWLLMRPARAPEPTPSAPASAAPVAPPTALDVPPPAPAPAETMVTSDPVIESQSLHRATAAPSGHTAPRASASSAPAPAASAAPTAEPPKRTPAPGASDNVPPDFDELKKGIKH